MVPDQWVLHLWVGAPVALRAVQWVVLPATDARRPWTTGEAASGWLVGWCGPGCAAAVALSGVWVCGCRRHSAGLAWLS